MTLAFQDKIPDNLCFGCGPGNVDGLQIKSVWASTGESVCTYQPETHHAAGPPQFVNGGIIATLIDCHAVCTAIAFAYESEGREIGSDPPIWYATASLEVRYLQPTPIEVPVEVRARIVDSDDRKTRLSCTLSSLGNTCAEGEVVAVQVPNEWREPK